MLLATLPEQLLALTEVSRREIHILSFIYTWFLSIALLAKEVRYCYGKRKNDKHVSDVGAHQAL